MTTPLAGVMGWPVAHSLSPRLHGYWLSKYGIDGAYLPLKVAPETLGAALAGLPALGFSGCNVTVPHKEAVIPYLKNLTARARRIGAVNTIWCSEEGLWGDCTDGEGFMADLSTHFPEWQQHKNNVVVIGAGGAARAVLAALHEEGCRNLTILNRTPARATAVCRDLGIEAKTATLESAALRGAGLVINTTSLGMQGQPPLALDCAEMQKNGLVYDLVYNPAETAFLHCARQQGLQTANGLGMLLHQAVPGFERWFGQRPVVDEALRTYMKAALPC
jgi:shikimate dehydrogenase